MWHRLRGSRLWGRSRLEYRVPRFRILRRETKPFDTYCTECHVPFPVTVAFYIQRDHFRVGYSFAAYTFRPTLSKSCPLNFSPLFSSSSDFSRGNEQYSQQCWRANRRFYDDYGDNGCEKKREKKEVRRNTRTFRIIRHSQTCKQRRNTCCCKFPCEFPQRELTRLFSYVMSPVWTFDTTVWFR